MCHIQESGITKKASRETGALTFFPEGRTYSPPRRNKLCISHSAASGRVRSLRCSSSPHKVTDFAGTPLRRCTACGRRALYEVLFRYFAPKRQICFGGSTPPFSPRGEKQQMLHTDNRFTREEQVTCQMHSGNMRTKNF